MVALNIITNSETNAEEIINYLMEESLVFETITVEKVQRRRKNLAAQKSVLIMGITKALLFRQINEELQQKFPDYDLTIYSVPVVDMDLSKQKELITQTRNV